MSSFPMGDAAEPVTRAASRWRWLGFVGALALAAGSWGAGSRPELNTGIVWPGIAPTSPTGGSPLLATVCVLAMGLWVWSWWRLRGAAVDLRWWWTTVTLWFAPLLASIPFYSRDLYSYAAQGALWRDGLNPYLHTVAELDSPWRESTAPTWLDSPTPYGPVWLSVARLVATVAGDQLPIALLLLRIAAVAGLVAMAWAVASIARSLKVDPARAAWLGVAAPVVGAHFVSGAHNDAVMVGLVLVGLALALRQRFAVAVALVALAAMIKVTALIAVPFIVLLWAGSDGRAQNWAGIIKAGIRSVALVGVLFALAGYASGLGFAWLNPANTAGKNEQWTSLPTGLGMLFGGIAQLFGADSPDRSIAVARAVGLGIGAIALVLIWLRVAHAGESEQPTDQTESAARIVRACGWAFLTFIVFAPVFLGWYFLWALPILAASLTSAAPESARRWLPVVATILCFSTLPDGYSLGLRTAAIGIPLCVIAAVVLARAGWRTGRRIQWRSILDLHQPLLAPAPRPQRAETTT